MLPACRRPEPPRPTSQALLSFAGEAARLLERQPPQGGPTRARLDALVARARSLATTGDRDPVAGALLDERLGIRPDPVDDSLERALLPSVLEQRRGSCLGLAGVYLAIAEALGVQAQAVLVPGHVLVHRADGRTLELLEGGRVVSQAELRRRYAVPPGNPLYLRGLAREELLAAFRFNLANALRERRRYRDAIAQYTRTLETLPDLAEGHLNLGLCHHRLGEHRLAERAYLRAAALHPALDGLRGNLELLRREVRPDAGPTRGAEAGIRAEVGVER